MMRGLELLDEGAKKETPDLGKAGIVVVIKGITVIGNPRYATAQRFRLTVSIYASLSALSTGEFCRTSDGIPDVPDGLAMGLP